MTQQEHDAINARTSKLVKELEAIAPEGYLIMVKSSNGRGMMVAAKGGPGGIYMGPGIAQQMCDEPWFASMILAAVDTYRTHKVLDPEKSTYTTKGDA